MTKFTVHTQEPHAGRSWPAGYILGGAVAGPLGWRAGFLLEAAAMLPFALLCLFGRALDLKGKPTGAVPSC